MRESDGTHFLYNGEGCIRVSPTKIGSDTTPQWHYEYGCLPDAERLALDTFTTGRIRIFEVPGYGRHQIITRGVFKEL